MLPLIQSVPVLSQHPVNKSKTLQLFTLFTPFAPTYCRWDSTLLPKRFMGRPVIRTPLWKIGLKSVRSSCGLWHKELLFSQVVVHPCPPDKQWKASLQTLHTFTLIVDQLNRLQRKGRGSKQLFDNQIDNRLLVDKVLIMNICCTYVVYSFLVVRSFDYCRCSRIQQYLVSSSVSSVSSVSS